MHEIITLQFGQRSNYLATHFWNAQESYFSYSVREEPLVDPNVHFRAGIGADSVETFTPRTVIYDLKGGFGSLRRINALYDVQETPTATRLWDGSTLTQQQQPIEPSPYQTLLDQGLPTHQLHDHDVKYWSDYNRVFYHPRSAVQLNEYELNSQLMPFENWSAGEELFRDLDKEFDLLDRDVRPFAEECDQMQGLQLLTGSDDAWGGFAARYLDNLRDEYGKTSIWVWGSENTTRLSRQEQLLRSSNAARSMAAFGQQASAYIRMATIPKSRPPYLNLSSSSDWVTSALQCAALESATLPSRLTRGSTYNVSLPLLESILNTNGSQNILDLQFSRNTDAIVNGTSNGVLSGQSEAEDKSSDVSRLDISFNPGQNQADDIGHTFARTEVLRSRHSSVAIPSMAPDERMRRRLNEEAIVEKFETELTFPLLDSFPDSLFRSQVVRGGLELTAALSCTSSMKAHILHLRDLSRSGLTSDDREATYNDLSELANQYSFGWDSGSDSGADV